MCPASFRLHNDRVDSDCLSLWMIVNKSGHVNYFTDQTCQ